MELYFGCYGKNVNSIKKSWLLNIEQWLNTKSNYVIKKNNPSFFCISLKISLVSGIKQINETNRLIDGNIFFNNKIYNSEKYDSVISHLEKGECNGRYTAINYNDGVLTIYNDYYGCKPFFYYKDNENLYFSNDIRIMLLCPNIPFEIDLDKCKLSNTSSSITNEVFSAKTYFKGIRKLPEGVLMSYENNDLKINEVFHPTNFGQKEYYDFNDNSEYYRLFRSTLNSLIKNIVQTHNSVKIGVSLSGGIDSAVILASLIDLGYKDKIICYHASSQNPAYYSCNDSEIVKKLVKDLNVKCKIFYQNNGNSICNAILGRDYIQNINGPCCIGNDSFGYHLAAELEKDNVNLILGGDGGDYMFTGTRYYADMLKFNKQKLILKLYNKTMRAKQKKYFFYKCCQFLPFVNNWVYKQNFWVDTDIKEKKYPTYFSSEMKRVNKKIKINNFNNSKKLKFWSRRLIYDFMFPKNICDDEQYDGYDFIHPLLDKSIYDFAQKTPPYIHYDIFRGELGSYFVQKRILRESYKDILPSYITEQKNKTNYASSLVMKLRKEKENIIKLLNSEELQLSKFNIVNKNQFLTKIKIFFSNIKDPHFVPNLDTKYLYNLIFLEIWLREVKCGKKWLLDQCKIKSKIDDVSLIEVINENI